MERAEARREEGELALAEPAAAAEEHNNLAAHNKHGAAVAAGAAFVAAAAEDSEYNATPRPATARAEAGRCIAAAAAAAIRHTRRHCWAPAVAAPW